MKGTSLIGAKIVRKLGLFSTIGVILSLTLINSTSAQEIVKNITLDRQIEPNPLMVRGTSGGNIPGTEVVKTRETATGYCSGFVSRQPNHILTLNTFFDFLKIEVESSADTTILVQGPGGVWCNDDSNNVNPALEGQWQQGKYKIWIGSYQENISNSYRIRITGNNP